MEWYKWEYHSCFSLHFTYPKRPKECLYRMDINYPFFPIDGNIVGLKGTLKRKWIIKLGIFFLFNTHAMGAPMPKSAVGLQKPFLNKRPPRRGGSNMVLIGVFFHRRVGVKIRRGIAQRWPSWRKKGPFDPIATFSGLEENPWHLRRKKIRAKIR